jgi:hypothetical protein
MRTGIIALGLVTFLSLSLLGIDQVTAVSSAVAANAKVNCKCPGNNPDCECPPNTVIKPKASVTTKGRASTSAKSKSLSKDKE